MTSHGYRTQSMRVRHGVRCQASRDIVSQDVEGLALLGKVCQPYSILQRACQHSIRLRIRSIRGASAWTAEDRTLIGRCRDRYCAGASRPEVCGAPCQKCTNAFPKRQRTLIGARPTENLLTHRICGAETYPNAVLCSSFQAWKRVKEPQLASSSSLTLSSYEQPADPDPSPESVQELEHLLVVHKKDHLRKLEEGLRLAESFAGAETLPHILEACNACTGWQVHVQGRTQKEMQGLCIPSIPLHTLSA